MKTIDISKSFFDIIDGNNGYYFISGGAQKLKTPRGKIVKSRNSRLLTLIADELNTKKILDPGEFSYYSIFSTEADIIIKKSFNKDFIRNFEENIILNDPVLKSCAGPEIAYQMKNWSDLLCISQAQ